jgi:hypothetical protein
MIAQAAEFWDCNETTALMRSAEFARRMDANVQKVLARGDLTFEQKREIAETLTSLGTYVVEVTEETQLTVE